MKMLKYEMLPFLFFVFVCFNTDAQKWDSKKLDKLSALEAKGAIFELQDLLSIPNNALIPEHVENNVRWCEKAFTKRGFQIKILSTEGPPIMIAEKKVNNPNKTVLFYLQVDGQPVDSSKWDQENPYTPELKELRNEKWDKKAWEELKNEWNDNWRVFARSASDAKGPIVMFLAAVDIINKENFSPEYNIKVILDFEEELGSPHLPEAVNKYKSELAADWFVILDGPRHISNQPTLTFGARGITTITLTVFGPRVPQHSGHYGNYIPNPALRLSQLLASMKD